MRKVIILVAFALLIVIVSLFFIKINSRNIAGSAIFPLSYKTEGEVYSISVLGQELKVLNEATIQLGVRNTANEKYNYKLYVFIKKDGVVKDGSDFSFSLKPNSNTIFSLTFIPDTVGEHEILTNLYNELETKLLDTKTLKVKATSDVGPFDFSLDILARTIPPAETLPIIVKMINTGEKGSEVKVKVSMYCTNHTIGDQFFVFLKPNIETEKTVSLLTCDEKGLKIISAELVLFNTTLATSSSQVFIRQTPTLKLKIPEKIEVRAGGSKILGIVVENDANISVNNLKSNIENIPSAWFDTEPFTIVNVKPGEEAIFILNLSIPKDAESMDYPIKINVGGDEIFTTEKSTLRVLGTAKTEPIKSKISITTKNKRAFFLVTVGLAALLILIKIINMAVSYWRMDESYRKRRIALMAIRR